MTYTTNTIQDFLATVPGFSQLPPATITRLLPRFQLLRYRMGQAILVREKMPIQISILYEGQARYLGYDPRTQLPSTLKLLNSGEVLGWAGLLRGMPCETAIASNEVICITLAITDFLELLEQEAGFAAAFRQRCALVEGFDLLGAELQRQPINKITNLKDFTQQVWPDAVVMNLPKGRTQLSQLDSSFIWLVSGGGTVTNYPVASRLDGSGAQSFISVEGPTAARLVGFPAVVLGEVNPETNGSALVLTDAAELLPLSEGEVELDTGEVDIPYAPERVPGDSTAALTQQAKGKQKYPYIRARGPLNATLACFQMLAQHLGLPFRRDVVQRVLTNQMDRSGSMSLQVCGAIAELMGLNAQLVNVPAATVSRLPAPALIRWQDSCAVLYEISDKAIVLAVPETGIRRLKPADFAEVWGQEGQVLLLKPTKQTPKQRFGLGWFLPSLIRYRKVLIEVLIASFFVQLFSLANPLMLQIIIDRVLVQNSLDTLNVLGIFLILMAFFESLLMSLRTYLFVDTTNRIDMALGSEIIDHLLRLPLKYFEKRPVGELSSRINELENIRQFLTGTALTVVLDAVFSVIYIVVMFIYSWLLTIVALATIPLFAILTALVSPIIRRQLRAKAERNAETQSYLVEVMSGIQTVKAQNIELRSRWQWQERYARYVSAGFQTVLTSTTAGATSNLLNKISGLLVLWVGAYLVIAGQLTLGQLFAFRIIAGYVTTPLLRLTQLWQNFQETALSLERLSDIIDTPQEADELDRQNIPMPTIQGAVTYDDIVFSFNKNSPPQLNHISIEFPAGIFVGVVGQSGSGKSTLMKLLPRLYEPDSGRILIDNYDINKVELYSLRRQVGIVPQEPLLFDGTVQENIALTQPDATSEEIIAAAKVAAAHDFIMTLPNGYNTRVGERGSALSGGQRQRVAIARTVLQNPRLLILDEATSALDYDTERQVCLNLADAFHDRTVFFITHRLSTIKNADMILMMDRGSVVETGTHEELMNIKGRYYCLYQQQESQM
ncbi:peptidase domain-containing ABC transporter [Trichocoleus sp. FACHB-591]|uniref:peptidase domain-containing ABC transporter n=1 Tax=Trichocoleus sp. FACHB-591 TaxID=2692872 RepID=UPI00168511E6|nr:peptidase domain-containing ABC transporter [Trichocoleus sp. FACHB-591]MBD2097246.1 peptidase domain-containing ABC transporter [Trichocoleus sp. FACHB-591]